MHCSIAGAVCGVEAMGYDAVGGVDDDASYRCFGGEKGMFRL